MMMNLLKVGFGLDFPYWVALLFALQDELSCLGVFALYAVLYTEFLCVCVDISCLLALKNAFLQFNLNLIA